MEWVDCERDGRALKTGQTIRCGSSRDKKSPCEQCHKWKGTSPYRGLCFRLLSNQFDSKSGRHNNLIAANASQ